MLTSTELRHLVEELADSTVLSVYLDTSATDPAMRDAWRTTLVNALREAREQISDKGERTEFDRAAALLDDPFPTPGGIWGAPGWVAFATAGGHRYVAALPVQPTPLVVWAPGPVVSPYLRALKQHRPVIVALVDSQSARLYRYALRKVEEVGELGATTEDPSGAERITGPPKRATGIPAIRGAVGTDEAQRQREAAFRRMATSLAERLEQLAGDASWVLIGGTPEWALLAKEALPRDLADRTLVSAALGHDASKTEIAEAAKVAASESREAEGNILVAQLVEEAGGHGHAAAGVPAVQRALHLRAVDVLLVSPDFIAANPAEAERMVRAAFLTGADVEVPSGDAATQLDQVVEGVAARLRFAIDERPESASGAPG